MPRLEANAIHQNVRLAGAEAAPALLLVHGLGWDHTLFDGPADRLAATGWRVVAPDLRGMGATDKPDAPYSIDLYAEDLLALMEGLAIPRFGVIGFSLGGMVAAAMLEKAPDRIASAVLACCGLHSSEAGRAGTEAMLARAETLGPLAFAREQADAIWHPGYSAANPEAVERFIDWRAAMDQAALARAFRASYGTDFRSGLARIGVPVRYVAADSDPFASVEMMAGLAASTPGADLVVIEGCGHMAPVERPEAFEKALTDFLDRAFPPKA